MVRQHMLPNALEKAGRPEEALQQWRAILERFPDDVLAKRRSETLEKELAPKPGPTA
jgi:triphosphoribosyl-dephospho-CoA synthetase